MAAFVYYLNSKFVLITRKPQPFIRNLYEMMKQIFETTVNMKSSHTLLLYLVYLINIMYYLVLLWSFFKGTQIKHYLFSTNFSFIWMSSAAKWINIPANSSTFQQRERFFEKIFDIFFSSAYFINSSNI